MLTLSPSDEAVLTVIAHGNTVKLDDYGLQPEWLSADPVRAIVSGAFSLSRAGRPVDPISLRLKAPDVRGPDWPPVLAIFRNGHADVEPKAAVEAAHAAYIAREADVVRGAINLLYQESPARVSRDLPPLIQKLNDLYTNTRIATAKPSEIYAQDVPEVKWTSRVAGFNQVLSGGYRNGCLALFVGPPKNGKSSVLRFCAVDGLMQQKRVSYLISENVAKKAMHDLLRALTGLTPLEIARRKGNTPERDACLHAWLGHCDEHLHLYGAERYSTSWIERILAWDKPDLLVVDYLREVAGMIPGREFVKDPVGDMAYRLLDLSNHFGCAIVTAAQMSAENAKKFEAGKFLESAPSTYGTDRPRQAVDLYVGVRRAAAVSNATSFFPWSDRYGGPVHHETVLAFDPARQILALP